MDTNLIREILRRENKRRLIYPYYKGRYAIHLLRGLIGEAMPIRKLRQSPASSLLHSPAVQPALQAAGDGVLRKEQLELCWPEDACEFVLDFGIWEEDYQWAQTSRPGANLVVRLNFSNRHDRRYQEVLANRPAYGFNNWGHPVNTDGRATLAWARVDVDPDNGEALIEEIQNDWLRTVRRVAKYGLRCRKPQCACLRKTQAYARAMRYYEAIWSEAMLAATLEYLHSELSIARVYYHSFDTCCVLKRLKDNDWLPPKSVYEQVPRRFAMQTVPTAPKLVTQCSSARRRLRKVAKPRWFTPSTLPMGGLHHA